MSESPGHGGEGLLPLSTPSPRHNMIRQTSSSSQISRRLLRHRSADNVNEPNNNSSEIRPTLSHQPSATNPEQNANVFQLTEPSVNLPSHEYDVDVVAVHSCGADLKNAWLATPPQSPDALPTPMAATSSPSTKSAFWRDLLDGLNKTAASKQEHQTPYNTSSSISKINWLRDGGFLPTMIPTARVLLFEYLRPRSEHITSSLDSVTQEFCKLLVDKRQNLSERPIIFIGHDFGVTIIEKTLMDCKTAAPPSLTLCRAAAAIVFLASAGPDLDANSKLDYFDLIHDRRLYPDSPRPPYIETRNDDFLPQHVAKFKQFAEWLTDDRSAMTLKAFVSDGKFSSDSDAVYSATVSVICNIREVYPFHLAASEGDHERVKYYLEKGGRYRNLQNAFGQTALHLAVRRDHMQVIRVLVEGFDADVTVADYEGQTPLHLAMKHCRDNHELMELLFQRGADINLRNKAGESSLDLASESKVDPSVLETRFLFQGPSEDALESEIEEPRRPEFQAAAQACRHFRATIAEFHIIQKKEQVIRAQPTVDEVLYKHGPEAILKAKRRKDMTGSPRCRWFHLPANNVAWVEDLFKKMGLVVEKIDEDQHEGPMPWSRYMRPQSRILKPFRCSEDPAGKCKRTEVAGKNFLLFMPFLNYEKACDSIIIQKALKIASTLEKNRRNDLVPTTQMIKEDTNERHHKRRISSLRRFGRLSPLPEEYNPSNSSYGDVSSAPGSLHSHPNSQVVPRGSVEKGILNVDADRLYRLESERILINGYLYEASTAKSLETNRSCLGPLHARRTLDQSHYFMLDDTSNRDGDQVVLRGARGREGASAPTTSSEKQAMKKKSKAEREKEEHPLVMVDQLWLWVVDGTVITSFPQKWSRHTDVLERLLEYLRNKERAQIQDPMDLVHLIITFTVGVFNRPETGKGLGLHDYFEAAVGAVADREINLFRQFERNIKTDPTEEKSEAKLNAIYEIRDEVKLMRETKDIRDELTMILRILSDQAIVTTDMNNLDWGDSTPSARSPHSPFGGFRRSFRETMRKFVPPYQHSPHQVTFTSGDADVPTRADVLTVGDKDQHPYITANERDFSRMLSHAHASYDALNHLLDLKQKSANATEARFARKGAEETAKQGRTIVLFTIATIIFGSLSFVTAFFALSVSAFPPGGSQTPWELGHIVGYVVGISVGLAIPFVLFAFAINPTLKFWERWHEGAGAGADPAASAAPSDRGESRAVDAQDAESESEAESQAGSPDELEKGGRETRRAGGAPSWARARGWAPGRRWIGRRGRRRGGGPHAEGGR